MNPKAPKTLKKRSHKKKPVQMYCPGSADKEPCHVCPHRNEHPQMLGEECRYTCARSGSGYTDCCKPVAMKKSVEKQMSPAAVELPVKDIEPVKPQQMICPNSGAYERCHDACPHGTSHEKITESCDTVGYLFCMPCVPVKDRVPSQNTRIKVELLLHYRNNGVAAAELADRLHNSVNYMLDRGMPLGTACPAEIVEAVVNTSVVDSCNCK